MPQPEDQGQNEEDDQAQEEQRRAEQAVLRDAAPETIPLEPFRQAVNDQSPGRETEQRNGDDQEGEVVEEDRAEDPRQDDLEGQQADADEEDTEIEPGTQAPRVVLVFQRSCPLQ
ncbi:MAG: hypothetical protein GTO30_18790 [Acidobacteria bacterium]|nr:hypothetical protein [Acidobacteriota bacterium]NIM63612.1 hypothetical protein [Acidobacteriota bacterium]NIT10892.1 hypothetical protein [Acidobacteriota bacterium]